MENKELHLPANTRPPIFYGYIVVIAVFVVQLAMNGSHHSFGVFFKPLLVEFGWSRTLISGALSIYSITRGLAGTVMGGLNDRFGPRVVVTLCGLLLGAGFLLMSRITALWQFYLFYVLIIGVGMGGLLAPQLSTVTRWFVRRRNAMIGIVVAGGGIGGLVMPPAINWVISAYGWRNAYLVLGVVALVIVTAGAQFLRRDPEKTGRAPYGADRAQAGEPASDSKDFTLREATRTPQFWLVVFMFFCFGFVVVTIRIHIVPYVTDLGISAAAAATILGSSGGAIILGSIVFGVGAGITGNRRALIICFALMSAAVFLLLTSAEIWSFYLAAVFTGLAMGGTTTSMPPLVAELFGVKSHSSIFGICGFGMTAGAAVGPFIAGYTFDVTGAYRAAFLACAACGIASIVATATLRRPVK